MKERQNCGKDQMWKARPVREFTEECDSKTDFDWFLTLSQKKNNADLTEPNVQREQSHNSEALGFTRTD